MLNKTLLGSAAVIMAVVGAQAADLPSKKAAPATYVKICDAYGAGFFYIPGGDTCVRLGGYVRAEYQYTPGKDTYGLNGAVSQVAGAQSSAGYEMRGRVDVDARTPTSMGVARTFVRIRGVNASGVRTATEIVNAGTVTNVDQSASALALEAAMVQWAGFTFGIAPENYAMMPGSMYNGMPWAGFPNGMKQIAYTATFGGGWSATVAIEDRNDSFNMSSATNTAATFLVANQYVSSPTTVANLVGNVRLDQAWGFAAVHGMVGNNSVNADVGTAGITAYNAMQDGKAKAAYAFGMTARINLPMIAAGDNIHVTANYASGMTGALIGGGLSAVSNAAQRRELGGIVRNDSNMNIVGGTGAVADPFRLANTTGWNVGALMTHYWMANLRSNFALGYVQLNPGTQALGRAPAWGRGSLWDGAAAIIYSPVRDFDIGLEFQYASVSNKVQNEPAAWVALGRPGATSNNYSTKLRVERTF